MRIMFGHSIKRLLREGVKSLSVPLIALVFVLLINLLGGIRLWLDTQYEDTLDNFPIIAVLSNLSGDNTDELEVDMRYIDMFIDPDVNFSLYDLTGDIALRRTVDNAEISGRTGEVTFVGISNIRADDSLNTEHGVNITFFDGYDDRIFTSDELVCVVSEELYLLAVNGSLNIGISIRMDDEIEWLEGFFMANRPGSPHIMFYFKYDDFGNQVEVDFEECFIVHPGEIVTHETEFRVVGTVSGIEHGTVFSPFWPVSHLAEELTEVPPFSDSLSVRVGNNRELDEFKEIAAISFPRINPIFDSRPFAMTIMDSEFFETLEPLRQNIIVVDVATPFIYLLSVAVGFLTSVLLTRRRKAEFAIMRSIGVSKWVVFMSALSEQTLLSVAGAALGFAFVALVWDYTSLTRPAVFLVCYLLGALFASIGAAGTNVMKVLRDRRE